MKMNNLIIEDLENYVEDLVSDFLFYNRKEDEDLPKGMIEEAIKNGNFSVDDLIKVFELKIRKGLKVE